MNAIFIILQIIGFIGSIVLFVVICYIVGNCVENNLQKQIKWLKEDKKKLQEELKTKNQEYTHKLVRLNEQFVYYKQNSNKEKQALLQRISKLERELSLKRKNR